MTTAIVTGASGGIGRACVRALAPDHDIVAHYHSDRESAEAIAGEAREAGSDAVVHRADLADPDEAAGVVERAREAFGGVDVLVNNAGVFYETGVLDIGREGIETTIRVNLLGTIYCTRAALPGMLSGDGGRIVCVASTAGTRGSSTDPAYGSSKAGMIGFAKSVARAYTDEGVFANVVAPSATDTKMYAEYRRPSAREAIPIGRLVDPEEVADAVRFFAESTAISGKVLEVDGGQYR